MGKIGGPASDLGFRFPPVSHLQINTIVAAAFSGSPPGWRYKVAGPAMRGVASSTMSRMPVQRGPDARAGAIYRQPFLAAFAKQIPTMRLIAIPNRRLSLCSLDSSVLNHGPGIRFVIPDDSLPQNPIE